MKKCNECNETKERNKFNKNGKYLRNICTHCINIKHQTYLKTKEIKENIIGQLKTCTKCKIAKELNCFHNCKQGKYNVKSYCKDCKIILAKIEYDNNIEHYLNEKKTYYINNKEKIVNNVKKYRKDKLLNDSFFKMKENIRGLIKNSFRRKFTTKAIKTINILGCTFDVFKKHLEEQFDEHMNWNNQGSYWHMDHIKPISLATNEQELIKLNHYTNFQPLYWEDNLSKGNKYNEDMAVKVEDKDGILY